MTWLLRQRWFWMLFFLLLLAIIVPFLVIGILVRFSPNTIFISIIVLAVVLLVLKSYRDWKLKQNAKREENEQTSSQKDL